MKKASAESNIKNFSIADAKLPNVRVATISGYSVEILTLEANDPNYKVQGYIGKSTQLETWTANGKHYAKEKKKEKFQNVNNLVILE